MLSTHCTNVPLSELTDYQTTFSLLSPCPQ
jgi:hypothetical protein